MTTPIGLEPTKTTLILATGGDFVYSFRWEGGDFPAGSGLTLIIATTSYPFTIMGDTASVKIESTAADVIADRAGFRLIYTDTATTPSTETVLAYGQVKRVGPR